MTWVWHGYYNVKVIYEDTFGVPINKKVYKSYRISFFYLSMHNVSCEE